MNYMHMCELSHAYEMMLIDIRIFNKLKDFICFDSIPWHNARIVHNSVENWKIKFGH